MRFANVLELFSNPNTQQEAKDFLSTYHDHLKSKFSFPGLKDSKALHAAAETLGKESWHHISRNKEPAQNREAPSSSRLPEIWGLQYWEVSCSARFSPDRPLFFRTKAECIHELWDYVKDQMIESDELLGKALRDMESGEYSFLSKETANKLHGSDLINQAIVICDSDEQWALFESHEVDITDMDFRLELCNWYFEFFHDNANGFRAGYQIYPVVPS